MVDRTPQLAAAFWPWYGYAAEGNRRLRLSRLLLAVGFVLGVFAIAAVVAGRSGQGASAPGARVRALTRAGPLSLTAIPLAARGVVDQTLGRDARAYWVRSGGRGVRVTNPAGFSARFLPDGVSVTTRGRTLLLRTVSYGRAGALHPVWPTFPTGRANRVAYARGALSEWFSNGPLGLEQGFGLRSRPSGSGSLQVALRTVGPLIPQPASSGVVFRTSAGAVELRYGGLVARDATGRRLPSKLLLQGRTILLRVADADAHYPIKIDPFVQQGRELTANDESGLSAFGTSVALSSDGNTALIGGPCDNISCSVKFLPSDTGYGAGAAWVFVRSGSTWSEQAKLTANDETNANNEGNGGGGFGVSVALSSDGNTALIGGQADNSFVGAAWAFTRSGTTWRQQGSKLTANDETANSDADFGDSVALSSDGNTALIGGDAADVLTPSGGAAWVFTRSGSTWNQQGSKLIPNDASGTGDFGFQVALSGDGSTALIGDPDDNSSQGAAWVFAPAAPTWTQQGSKLTESGSTAFGTAVTLSLDGNTALIGSTDKADPGGLVLDFTRSGTTWSQQSELTQPGSNSFGRRIAISPDADTALISDFTSSPGAVRVFTRSGTSWSEDEPELTPCEQTPDFGGSVALSSDDTTALIGGDDTTPPNFQSSNTGAAWVFAQSTGQARCASLSGSGPSCTLKTLGRKVFASPLIEAAKHKHKKRNKHPKGQLRLSVTCNQAASLTLNGNVKAVLKKHKKRLTALNAAKAQKHKKKHKTKTFKLRPVHTSIAANKAITLVVKLTKAVLKALKKGAHEAVVFNLTATNANGTSTTSAKIKRLKLVKAKHKPKQH